MKKSYSMFCIMLVFLIIISPSQIYGQTKSDVELIFDDANKNFIKGEYKEAIAKYDKILEIIPGNISTLKMKGIAQSNSGLHEQSLKSFYKIYQYNPHDITALLGLAVGFGYLGEYKEAKKYIIKAYEDEPDSIVVQNYMNFIDRVISKYPYNPTEKPKGLERIEPTTIPEWVKPIAKWWSEEKIADSEFIDAIRHLIAKRIIQIPSVKFVQSESSDIPHWVKQRAGWWADGQISDSDFVAGLHFLIENGILKIDIQKSVQEIQKENEQDFSNFERYIAQISKNVIDEKRYIEFPNPSFDVIKKFLRDYVKWNFEQEAKSASEHFPNPTFETVNGTIIVHYKIFVNEQPSGLPLDHVSTLNNSLDFWERQDLSANNKTAKVKFEYTKIKQDANIWVTWVVRDLGQGVLGHAHLGKGVVEVALGDYSCDGIFELYDVKTVERIMTHELGHSIGLQHSTEQNNIMYPSMKPHYAYCLLS